jgi:hypothetical protein
MEVAIGRLVPLVTNIQSAWPSSTACREQGETRVVELLQERRTLMQKIMIAAVGALTLACTSLAAQAADTVITDDGEEMVVRERTVDTDAVIVDEPSATRVYGWTAERPLDCGAYHYWDGEACVDARRVPPDTGPKD